MTEAIIYNDRGIDGRMRPRSFDGQNPSSGWGAVYLREKALSTGPNSGVAALSLIVGGMSEVSTIAGSGSAGLDQAADGTTFVVPSNIYCERSEVSRYALSLEKRFLDVCIAAVMLVIFLPVIALVSIAVKLESKGPILFMQRRSGIGGRPFTIFKFRSMTNDSCKCTAGAQATLNDPRVTAVGKFIRRTSLDELPQLLNVIKGEMSLVGPRPHMLLHDEYYGARLSQYSRRFEVRPGLTGLAQINGARGETPHISDMARRVALDAEYTKSASMIGDIALLISTVSEMLNSKKAL